MNRTIRTMKLFGVSWTALGFKRGIDDYTYHTYRNTNENTYSIRPPRKHMYSEQALYGIFGSIVYICPLFIPMMVCKEIYRAEINIRGLDKEPNYHSLF